MTAAGVSGGIDLALTLVGRMAGAPSKASPEIRELVRVMLDDQRDRLLEGTL